jgi:hypothetical protein
MSLITNEFRAAVEAKAHVFYIDKVMCQRWNAHRQPNQPRLLTGWCWEAKRSKDDYRTGIKTPTGAYIDAWYALVLHEAPPRIGRSAARLRVVADSSQGVAA